MKLKPVAKFYLREYGISALWYYGIITAVICLIGVSMAFLTQDGSMSDGVFSGLEFSSMIFLFVVGLNSFKRQFQFFTINGVSRKNILLGFICSALAISFTMALVDIFYSIAAPMLVNYSSLFQQLYVKWDESSIVVSKLVNFVWNMMLYTSAISAGFLITTLYYRMTKTLKLVVSIGVPAYFFMLQPALDASFNQGRLTLWLSGTFRFLMGLSDRSYPLMAIGTMLVAIVVLSGLSYMLTKRAVIKAQ